MPNCKPLTISEIQERFGACKTLKDVREVEKKFKNRVSNDVLQKHAFRIRQIITLGFVMVEDVVKERRQKLQKKRSDSIASISA